MMMNESHRALLRTHGTMVGRMLMGLLFVFSGAGIILGGIDSTASMIDSMGLPLAGVLVYLVIILKLGAGGALMLGYRSGWAAAALIVFTALTILVAHLSLEDINLFKNLAIIGGLLYVMAYGAGEGWKLEGNGHKPAAASATTDPLSSTGFPPRDPM